MYEQAPRYRSPRLFSPYRRNLLPSNSGFTTRLFHRRTRKPMLIRSNPTGIVSGHEDARETFYGLFQWQLSLMGIKRVGVTWIGGCHA